jgi:hypothetical protein
MGVLAQCAHACRAPPASPQVWVGVLSLEVLLSLSASIGTLTDAATPQPPPGEPAPAAAGGAPPPAAAAGQRPPSSPREAAAQPAMNICKPFVNVLWRACLSGLAPVVNRAGHGPNGAGEAAHIAVARGQACLLTDCMAQDASVLHALLTQAAARVLLPPPCRRGGARRGPADSCAQGLPVLGHCSRCGGGCPRECRACATRTYYVPLLS